MSVLLATVEETDALGERLGMALAPRDFVALSGGLGAGKTTFVGGVARGAGVKDGEVMSPTFAIVNTYEGRIPLYHSDWYRVTDELELVSLGFFEALEGPSAFLVEWPERVPSALPADCLLLEFEVVNPEQRAVSARPRGTRAEALLARWGLPSHRR